MSWNKIIECVPNFSEGRDLEKIDQIVAPFRSKAGVKLLDYSNDEDHNRLVVTLVGELEALYEAIVEADGERILMPYQFLYFGCAHYLQRVVLGC
jgi:glutamate formiminotransferase